MPGQGSAPDFDSDSNPDSDLDSNPDPGSDHDDRLWYDAPAAEWVEALPVGNGRLGGMVHGRPARERVALNDDRLWAGHHADRTPSGGPDDLDAVRECLWDGEFERAQRLCNEFFVTDTTGVQPYQPLGDLLLDCPGHDDPAEYRRSLDLREGVSRVEYTVDGTRFERECFASAPDGVFAVRIEADEPGAVDARVRLDRDRSARATVVDDTVVLRGQVIDPPGDDESVEPGGWGQRFEGRARVHAEGGAVAAAADEEAPSIGAGDGRSESDPDEDDGIVVAGADAVTVVVAAAVAPSDGDPRDECRETLAAVAGDDYAALRERHVADHRERMDRVDLDLGAPVDAPTDERLDRVRDGERDTHLAQLYFQYGRYLLLGSSRPGTLPANLQGIWNEEHHPPWDSDFTLDVNLEMNYWHAEVANLAECADPLVEYVDDLRKPGRETASERYGCEGFCAHLHSDRWHTTSQTADAHWGHWPMGAAWLCQNLWEHYTFSGDRADLERIYPVLREAAEFLLDYLVEHPEEDWLVTAPSASPENQFRTADGQEATTCVMPTMDIQLTRDLFGHCIEAADALDRDAEFAAELAEALDRLPPMGVTEHSGLREWLEDCEEVNPGHRHVSHLFGYYPADVLHDGDGGVTTDGRPDAADLALDPEEFDEAVRASLERRLDHGGGHTGWSCAWTIALFARLGDGEAVGEHVRKLLADSTYDSLLDAHPPFQIDGNFGGTAGIAEALVQSHGGTIRLLPALPETWDEGSVSGLRARGGFEVDVAWSDGTLDAATVRAGRDGTCRIAASDRIEAVETADGESVELSRVEGTARSGENDIVEFSVSAAESYGLVVDSG
ncbi:glycoside hydrolase family 95 protein [Halosimplex halobium]|uniref:glycoside hydrolase family 95 protein n=1 Tax=Halosimplex halobium TaxID=3396618 RepID=UPI003F5580E0